MAIKRFCDKCGKLIENNTDWRECSVYDENYESVHIELCEDCARWLLEVANKVTKGE